MRVWCSVSILLSASVLIAQSTVDHAAMLARLGKEADAFERTAYRIVGRETLTQTVPNGARIGRNALGRVTRLPGSVRTIVSEYGFLSEDVRGGSIREIRRVLTIDGQRWNKQSDSLRALARDLGPSTDKARQRNLERFEEYGLTGFVSDLGQLILLFARGGTARYEIAYEKTEDDGTLVFTFHQLDGPETVTVYGEGKEPARQRINGRLWTEPGTYLPRKISIETGREASGNVLVDRSVVEYQPGPIGILLPSRIVHEQFTGSDLLVTDEFEYSDFRQALPTPGSER